MARIAIIGSGPCGLSILRAFQQAEKAGRPIPEIVCYEKQNDWGGLWNYSWRTGTDQYGDPVHNSMYRYLWSNGPKECLEFADYTFEDHFGKPIPSFPPREVLHNYIVGRAQSANVRRYIQFGSVVTGVTYDKPQFSVTVKNKPDDSESTEKFDYVVVATGHFSVPYVPEYEGMKTFPGRIMHSHDFRDAEEFRGKSVIVLGSSYSAEDIALQSYKYGAKSVTIGYRNAPMGFDWPNGIKEVHQLERIDGNQAIFQDGHVQEADVIILCSGYLHHFPYLEEDLKLKTHNRLYPPQLYKGVVWQDNHQLFYLGMQDQFYTFNMFDAQAWYARDVIMGAITLPEPDAISGDIDSWVTREEALENPTEQIDFQTEYSKDLCKHTDYPPIDWDKMAQTFKDWEHHKEDDIMTYRDRAFSSSVTNTESPVHHTPWADAMDDSMETYLDTTV